MALVRYDVMTYNAGSLNGSLLDVTVVFLRFALSDSCNNT